MKISTRLTMLLILVSVSYFRSLAQEAAKRSAPARFLVKGALELGGDKVATVYFDNGETQSVKAGQGGSLAIGGAFGIPGTSKALVHATVGFKYVTTQADNAHIRLTRVPIIITANWMATEKLRFGAGVATHRAIRFKSDGIGTDARFDGATGPTFEVAYSGIGLTYTAMKYRDEFKNTYSANAIGLAFTLALPKR